MVTDQDVCTRKGRGRPKTFDRDAALDKAMELFWQHGYEATSLADLVAATGAKAPTLYAEFTNKEGLFRAALDRYIEQFAEQRQSALICPESGVARGVENYFRSTADCFTDGKKPAGCFFICTSNGLSSGSGEVADMLRQRHEGQSGALLEFLRERQLRGELESETDVTRLASYLGCVLQGMSVQAREGASRDALNEIVDTLMLQWPTLSRLGCKNA